MRRVAFVREPIVALGCLAAILGGCSAACRRTTEFDVLFAAAVDGSPREVAEFGTNSIFPEGLGSDDVVTLP